MEAWQKIISFIKQHATRAHQCQYSPNSNSGVLPVSKCLYLQLGNSLLLPIVDKISGAILGSPVSAKYLL